MKIIAVRLKGKVRFSLEAKPKEFVRVTKQLRTAKGYHPNNIADAIGEFLEMCPNPREKKK